MVAVSFTIKAGKSLWTNIDNAHPEWATYVGTGGESIILENTDEEYAEYLASSRCEYDGVAAPVAEFTGDVLSDEAPFTVQFTNTSTNSLSWEWDFGDTGTSTDENPSHEYTVPGTYTVVLTATNTLDLDELSDIRTRVAYIEVT